MSAAGPGAAPVDGWTPWERPSRWWQVFAVALGSWLLAAWAFAQSCLSFGGGGSCTPGVELPGRLMYIVLVWVLTGVPVLVALLVAALLITLLQMRKRRRGSVGRSAT